MQILEELYYGNIRPNAKFYGENAAFMELTRLLEKNRENLLEHLSEKEKETFEKFIVTQAEMDEMIQYENFSYGFRLGVMLTAEAFTGMKEMD